MINPKYKSSRPALCSWCNRTLWLLPEGVCGYCVEQDDYVQHMSRMERAERINARAKEQFQIASKEGRTK